MNGRVASANGVEIDPNPALARSKSRSAAVSYQGSTLGLIALEWPDVLPPRRGTKTSSWSFIR
jgi:hypothetical protein